MKAERILITGVGSGLGKLTALTLKNLVTPSLRRQKLNHTPTC